MLENGKLLPEGKTGPVSKRTVHQVHALLRNALADTVLDKIIPFNPAILATPPKVQGKKYRRKVRDHTKYEVERQLHISQTDKRYPPDTYLMALMPDGIDACHLRPRQGRIVRSCLQ